MKIDKSLLAKASGVGFSLFALKSLILIALYENVTIMEPNLPLLYSEIIIVAGLLLLSIQGFLQD